MHRPTVGAIAIVLLAIAGGIALGGVEAGHGGPLQAACLRIGAIMAILWFALPDMRRLRNPWLAAAIVLSIAIVMWRPKLLPYAVVVMIALYFLRPRAPRD